MVCYDKIELSSGTESWFAMIELNILQGQNHGLLC